jgi:hypothetical protein
MSSKWITEASTSYIVAKYVLNDFKFCLRSGDFCLITNKTRNYLITFWARNVLITNMTTNVWFSIHSGSLPNSNGGFRDPF